MNVFRFIIRNLKHFKKTFAVVFTLSMFDGAAMFLIPVLLAEFTKTPINLPRFPTFLAELVGLYIFSLLLQWVLRRYGEAAASKLEPAILVDFYQQLEGLPVDRLTRHHSGHILSLITKLSDSTVPIVIDLIWSIVRSVPQLLLFFIFTASQSVGLALFNVAVLAVFFILGVALSRGQIPLARSYNLTRAELMEKYVDFLTNMHTVRKLGLIDYTERILDRTSKATNERIDSLHAFHARRWLILHLFFGISFISTISIITWWVAHGQASPSLLIIYIAAYMFIRNSIERVTENVRRLMAFSAYLQSMEKITAEAVPVTGDKLVEWNRVDFRDIRYRYERTKKTVSVPEFHIARGERIGIRGRSGEGKTTLLNLVAGFLEPPRGTRTIDGRPFRQISMVSWQRRIAMVTQEVELFNMSIRENLCLGRDVGEAKILELLRALDLESWVMHLPDRLETRVGEKGIRLSSGQKQRMNLARGILLDRDLYLLDEPLSHLDAATAKSVTAYLTKFLRHKTAVIVSHHEGFGRICERWYDMSGHVLSAAPATRRARRTGTP